MKKNYIFTVLCITAGLFATAQMPPAIQWQKSLGGSGYDNAFSIAQTFDSGYIIAGNSLSGDGDITGNHGLDDYWIVKLNSSGDIQWQKSLGGSGRDAANSIVQTSDSGYIIAGFSDSDDGDITGNHGDGDYWIVKLNSSGDIQWQKSLGGSALDNAHCIKQLPDSGYIIAGFSDSDDGDVTGSHGAYIFDYWIVKLNSSGDIQWQKSLGGNKDDYATSVERTYDSGYIIAGYSLSADGDVTGSHGAEDYWIVKLNTSGDISWQKSLGGSLRDEASSVVQTYDSGYIIAGYSSSDDGDVTGNHGGSDYWIVKLNSSGDIQWQKSLGGSQGEYAASIEKTSDEGYIVAGTSYSNDGDVSGNHGYEDYWIVKLNSSGDIQWQKSLGGSSSDDPQSIKQTSDSGYIISGLSYSSDGDVSGNHGAADYWIVKLEPGVLLPANILNFSGEANGKQNLLHWATATEQNNTGFEIQHSADGYNFNKTGFIATKAINGNSNLQLSYDYADISYMQETNYYRLKQIDKDGRFRYSNIVVLKRNKATAPGIINTYPNPVKDILNAKIVSAGNNKLTLLITDLNGKLLLNKNTNAGNGETIVQLNVSHLPAGTYFLKMISTDGREHPTIKFVKQ